MGDEPRPIGDKVDVRIDSLTTLGQELKDDAEAFIAQMDSWDQKGREEHPTNAQIGHNAAFLEGLTVQAGNLDAYTQARTTLGFAKLGLEALRTGAESLAELYPGVDGFSNVQLAAVRDMFPEVSTAGEADDTALPPLEDWVLIGNQGWDTNHDGTVDIAMPAGGEQSPTPTDSSANDAPAPAEASDHEGYEAPVVTNPGIDPANDNVLSPAGQQNLLANEAREPMILAPGPLGTTESTSGSTNL
ncbi:MAG: hypothetical protein HKP61_02465 [Dactylosporangium sp.]|nr:hypothetical protein [Dactylosporangium sp.]NNJ59825.1 hypothetical protein [Dactylosporangium sp.]